jgi:hypothetical protein
LLGVLLAYHALAYICAFYVESLRHRVVVSHRCQDELSRARAKLCEARHTLVTNQRFLTDPGKEFLDLTHLVAAFSDE